MVNKGNAQGMYQSASGRVGLAILPHPFWFFFLEVRPHTIVWPTLCTGSHAPKFLPAMYAKYTTGGAFAIMASHDTNVDSNRNVLSV